MQISDVTNFLGMTNTRSQDATPPVKPEFDLAMEGDRKVLYSWTAPARTPLKGFNKKFLRMAVVAAVVVSLLLILMQEFFLILVVASTVFISYVLAATPSEEVACEVSNHGVKYAAQFYLWSELSHYFFTYSGDVQILNVDVKEGLPGRLFMTIPVGDGKKIGEIFGKYLPFLSEAPKTVIDKAYDYVLGKFDFESK
jgi:hypothetical protein